MGRREDLKRLLTGQCASTGSGRRQEMCLDRSSDWREAVGASPCQQVGSPDGMVQFAPLHSRVEGPGTQV